MSFESPYSDGTTWLRGNLHTHTTNSDGKRDPQVVVDDYADRGYDFLMISDHDLITDVDALSSHGMRLIFGNEVTAKGPHLLHVNASNRIEPVEDRQFVLDQIAREQGSLSILAHPNWHRTFDHYPQELLESLRGQVGLEIYNGVIERLPGSALATDRWDQLLGKGLRMWGFANDDSHNATDVELGWNVVQAEDTTVDSIVDAFRRGAFYASTGVTLNAIGMHDTTLSAESDDVVQWVVVAQFGKVVHRAVGSTFRYEIPAGLKTNVVRLEARGALGAVAWTQPFFRR